MTNKVTLDNFGDRAKMLRNGIGDNGKTFILVALTHLIAIGEATGKEVVSMQELIQILDDAKKEVD